MSTANAVGDFFITNQGFEPAYMALYRTGELEERANRAIAGLAECRVCPRDCDVNRLADETAVCKTGRHAMVSSYFPHFGEEDCLRGSKGSGTIFFSLCNLRCVFCQNYDISQSQVGLQEPAEPLAQIMLELQDSGCHNINFVTPEHVVPQVLEALVLAVKQGLRLPIVYNTSAYDSLHSLRLLDGIVDIYMPDFKFWDEDVSLRYLKARDYPQVARRAFREMHRQVGVLKMDENGIAKRGVLVRHLVMPGDSANTSQVMHFLAEELTPDTFVNMMAQYHPAHKVTGGNFPEINRPVTREEMRKAYVDAKEAGIWRFDHRRPGWRFL